MKKENRNDFNQKRLNFNGAISVQFGKMTQLKSF